MGVEEGIGLRDGFGFDDGGNALLATVTDHVECGTATGLATLVDEVLVGDAGVDEVLSLGPALQAIEEAVGAVGEANFAASGTGHCLWVRHRRAERAGGFWSWGF